MKSTKDPNVDVIEKHLYAMAQKRWIADALQSSHGPDRKPKKRRKKRK